MLVWGLIINVYNAYADRGGGCRGKMLMQKIYFVKYHLLDHNIISYVLYIHEKVHIERGR